MEVPSGKERRNHQHCTFVGAVIPLVHPLAVVRILN
jgi:hypothetical protein